MSNELIALVIVILQRITTYLLARSTRDLSEAKIMKRFIFSVMAVAVFCVGVGSLAERAGARFKSDEKALSIIRDARQAIGGETALVAVRGLLITGQTTRTLNINGTQKTIQGETEIALQLPDKLMKMMKIAHGDGEKGEMVQRQVDVVVVGDKANGETARSAEPGRKIVIKKADGTVQEYRGAEADKIIAADKANGADVRTVIIKRPEGDKAVVNAEIERSDAEGQNIMIKRAGPEHEAMRQNELLRLTLGLLLTAPQGLDVSYTFAGETDIDGTACNIILAEAAGSSFKIFIGKSSNLPVAMSYKAMQMPQVMMFRTKEPQGGEPKGDVVFTRKVDAPAMDMADFTVKFSDFRVVGGIQLPFKWTQTANGASDEVFDVSSYDVNPANIGDRFNNEKVKVRVEN